MGLFDSDFNIDSYVRTRIPQLDNLENRDLFKRIVGKLTVDLYNHVKDEYDALERRVFDEAPKAEDAPESDEEQKPEESPKTDGSDRPQGSGKKKRHKKGAGRRHSTSDPGFFRGLGILPNQI